MKYIDIDDFDKARKQKWRNSRQMMGLDPDGDFSADHEPMEELYQELLDGYSYALVAEERYGLQLKWLKLSLEHAAKVIQKMRRGVQF